MVANVIGAKNPENSFNQGVIHVSECVLGWLRSPRTSGARRAARIAPAPRDDRKSRQGGQPVSQPDLARWLEGPTVSKGEPRGPSLEQPLQRPA